MGLHQERERAALCENNPPAWLSVPLAKRVGDVANNTGLPLSAAAAAFFFFF